MTRRKAKSWLRRAGILELHGGRWVVSETRLRDRLPDVYDRVYAAFILTPLPKPKGDPMRP